MGREEEIFEKNPKLINAIYETLGFNKKEKIENPFNLLERIIFRPKDELGRLLNFRKNKIMNTSMYRVIPKEDWEYVLKTGKFKKSFQLKQNEKVIENLRLTNPEEYKKFIYGKNAEKFTRVTPKKEYASEFFRKDIDVLVEFKPIKYKLKPSTEYGGYDEMFAQDLSIKDILIVKDNKGNIVFQNKFDYIPKLEQEAKKLYSQYRETTNVKIGSKQDIEGFKEYIKNKGNKSSIENTIISGVFILIFAFGLLLIPYNLTGNFIGTSETTHKFIGIILSLLGISGFFIFKKLIS